MLGKLKKYINLEDIKGRKNPTFTLNGFDQDVVSKTTAVLHLYADGTSGDDANDGLTVGTPKLTLQAVFDLIPDVVLHNVGVNLSGTFELSKGVTLSRRMLFGFLVIGGEDDVTVVDDNGAANYSSTDAETDATQIGTSGAAWTPDEFRGYWVEVLDGPAAGDTRLVHYNTTEVVVPGRDFSADPGAAASYRFVRPKTTINADGGFKPISFNGLIGTSFFINNLSITGANARMSCFDSSPAINSVIQTDAVSDKWLVVGTSNVCGSTYNTPSPVDFVFSNNYRGLSLRGSVLTCKQNTGLNFDQAVLNQIAAVNSDVRFRSCSIRQLRLVGVESGDVFDSGYDAINFDKPASTWKSTRVGGNTSGVAIEVISSYLRIGAYGVEVVDSFSHGMDIKNSRVEINGVIEGTGNTGAGMHVSDQSTVTIKDGSTPTLTGTVGDVSLDGTTEESTWADIDAGTPINGATVGNNEFVIVKEV